MRPPVTKSWTALLLSIRLLVNFRDRLPNPSIRMGSCSSKDWLAGVMIGKASEKQLIDDQDTPGLNLLVGISEEVFNPGEYSCVSHDAEQLDGGTSDVKISARREEFTTAQHRRPRMKEPQY
jgi:hypothetical protein